MHITLFEDDFISRLFPITIGRAAFSISVGSLRLLNLVRHLGGELSLMVRSHLRDVIYHDIPDLRKPVLEKRRGPFLFINARTVPDASLIDECKKLFTEYPQGCILKNGRNITVAFLNESFELPPHILTYHHLLDYLAETEVPVVYAKNKIAVLESPADVIRYHMRIINNNLEFRIRSGNYHEIADGVFVPNDPAGKPTIGDYFISDTRKGPIILESNVDIGPFCLIRGPVYLGPRSRVIEHAAIKEEVAIGSVSKIGGEVEASVIEPYTNKQHHGFLGHSYLGSWVNLGAGTCNSDLKNSYNEVSLETPGGKVRSGLQFLGCVIGDYAKTAINTSIFTGKTIGACSMNYGFITTAVPSFVNYARSFGQVTEIPVELMIATQARMFARRNVSQRPCDIQLIRDMYEITRHERQLANEPLSL